jgi:hypothetical protein
MSNTLCFLKIILHNFGGFAADLLYLSIGLDEEPNPDMDLHPDLE